MNKNYIILAHKSPEQLSRLISRLDDGESYFYIHLDSKSDQKPFSQIQGDSIKFIDKREDCIWGDFSQVIAALNCIEQIMRDQRQAYTILLSGQDYPIKSKNCINNYLQQNAGYDHISMHFENVPEDEPTFYVNRLINIKINRSSKRGDFIILPYYWHLKLRSKISYPLLILRRRVFKRDILKMFSKRKMPFKQFAHGHQWWGLTFDTLKKVYQIVEENKKRLFGFYRNVLNAEESFFHSIIMEIKKNDPSIELKRCLTYIDWTPREGKTLPITFGESDLNMLLQQPAHKLFARKFDMDIDVAILNSIDERIMPHS